MYWASWELGCIGTPERNKEYLVPIYRRHDCRFDLQNDKELTISHSANTRKHHNIVAQNKTNSAHKYISGVRLFMSNQNAIILFLLSYHLERMSPDCWKVCFSGAASRLFLVIDRNRHSRILNLKLQPKIVSLSIYKLLAVKKEIWYLLIQHLPMTCQIKSCFRAYWTSVPVASNTNKS